MASRSASTTTATASSSATMPTGRWPNSSPENKLPPNWDARSRNSAFSRSPPTRPRPRAASSRVWRTGQDRLVSELRLAQAATLEQANVVLARFCADHKQRFARPATEATCDFRSLPRRFDLARCLSLRYQRVVAADHTVTLGAHAIALPPLPGHRGYAGETVELSHQLDGALRVYRGDVLLLTQPLPLEEFSDRRPAPIPTAQKRKTPMPRIYNLSGRPALAAVT